MGPLAADSPVVLARVEEGLPLVTHIGRQLRRMAGHVPGDDLRSAGHEALVDAARTFDETQGVPFRRWANLRIRGAMIDVVRASGDVPRHVYAEVRAWEAGDLYQEAVHQEDAGKPSPAAEEADRRLTQYLAGIATAMAVGLLARPVGTGSDTKDLRDDGEDPEEIYARQETGDRLRAAIGELPEPERKLIERHYFAGVTLEEAGKELGLSKSWASRLHARAIEGIARSLGRSRLHPSSG